MAALLQRDLGQATIPQCVKLELTLGNNLIAQFAGLPGPFNVAMMRLSDDYFKHYPVGDVTIVVGDTIIPISSQCKFDIKELVTRGFEVAVELHATATATAGGEDEEEGGMRASMATSEGGSWCVEPSLMMYGQQGMHPKLLDDVEKATRLGYSPVVSDDPVLGQTTVALFVNGIGRILGAESCKAYDLLGQEPIIVRITASRQGYTDEAIKVEVGQRAQLGARSYNGICGQLQRILAAHIQSTQRGSFLREEDPANAALSELVACGFEEAPAREALAASRGNVVAASLLLQRSDEASDRARLPVSAIKAKPAASYGLLAQLCKIVETRLTTLCDFCVICDCPHPYATGMLMPSVCSKAMCVFRFEELNVAREAASGLSTHALVTEMLLTFAKAAIFSARHELILKPYPEVAGGASGSMLFSQSAKNIDKLRIVAKEMPLRGKVVSTTPAGCALHQWILSSLKCHLAVLPPALNLSFMGTPYQYVIMSQSPERQALFEAARKTHGSVWAFHGSRIENWHSILRNGLMNVSGTTLQVNGAAYGKGIYISPHAQVSFGYSDLPTGMTTTVWPEHFDHDEKVRCICICELVNHEIKKSGNIWVQPEEFRVMTRFLFVYPGGTSFGSTTDLENKALMDQLHTVWASYLDRA